VAKRIFYASWQDWKSAPVGILVASVEAFWTLSSVWKLYSGLSILISGTSWNHKLTSGNGNMGMHFLGRNSRIGNAVSAGTLSWWSSRDPIVCNFNSNSHYPLPQKDQDLNITFFIHCDTQLYTFFMNYSGRIRKQNYGIFLYFYLLLWSFFCVGDCGVCHSSLCLLVSGSFRKNQLSSHVITPFKLSG
jgi:hypothetical protein